MKLVKRFLLDSRSQWWRLGFLTIALILAASFEIIAPRLLGQIVDAIVHGLEEHREINAILDGTTDTVVLLIIFYSCHAVFTLCKRVHHRRQCTTHGIGFTQSCKSSDSPFTNVLFQST